MLTKLDKKLTIKGVKVDKKAIRQQAIRLLRTPQKGLISELAQQFSISREAARKYVSRLITEGIISSTGQTRAKTFQLENQYVNTKNYQVRDLDENIVWRELFANQLSDLPKNVQTIWQYGITEMVNNAIDHSNSEIVSITVWRNALYTTATIEDVGEGIFLKIQKAFNLYDPRESILELAKGKLTTDPNTHTGEGIFFSSKMFDVFIIVSDKLRFGHSNDCIDNFCLEAETEKKGTTVFLQLDNDSTRKSKDIFSEYSNPEDFSFSKTIVPVKLAQYEGEMLISRSQAKRLVMRFEKFQDVVLDFDGVSEIGQAFADELFRVFPNTYPNTKLTTIHVAEKVQHMIVRALSQEKNNLQKSLF